MKSKLLKSIGIAVLCLAIVLGNVLAFSLGSTDGVWGRIDSNTGGTLDATCDGYAAVNDATYTLYDVMGIVYNKNVGPGGEDETYVRNASVCTGDKDGDMTFSGNGNPPGWTRTNSAEWTNLGSHTITCGTADGLFISEYVYDQRDFVLWPYQSGDDYLGIEIYNGTGGIVNLSGYSLLLFYNDRDFVKVDLTPTRDLGDGDVHVLVNNAATGSTEHEDQTFSNRETYRTVVLVKDYTYMDVTAVDFGWPETVQATPTTDENQVRYGEVSGSCPSTFAGFLNQSGFGFEGQVDSAFNPTEGQYFPVGRFCHYNNPINAGNGMDNVPLNLTINDIGCPGEQTLDPLEAPDDLIFTYNVSLDETPNNSSTCEYGPNQADSPNWPGGSGSPNVAGDIGPNRNGCADRVSWSASSTDQKFICRIDDDHTQEYTVSILGFTPSIAGAACPDTPVGDIQFNQIYTAEASKNCFCVYAAYTRGQITPVVLQNLAAVRVENGIQISWETVSEANNLGFNIMRAESVSGDQTQINPTLIMNELGPGGMFGAAYEYLDETAVEGVTYYYWLIDMPLDGSQPGIHGPISAER